MFNLFAPRRVYLDHAAATPLSERVARAMRPFERDICANPGGAHTEAVAARTALESARASIAQTFVTTNQNITFTSGGTESNNLAIVGTVERAHEDGRSYTDMEIVTTAIEHPSVLEPVRMLEKKGVVVRYVPTDSLGRISKTDLSKVVTEKTVLVTFAYANSEIGTVQDVKALSRVVRIFRTEQKSAYPYVHIDASQAPLWLPCRMDSLGVDMMTVDAGKCYGPKGAGVFARRGDVRLTPVIRGGSQEGGLRPGTEDVGKAVGSALAFANAQATWEERAKRIATLRDGFVAELTKKLPSLVMNGPWGDEREDRLPNNANISIPGTDGEFAVIGLDHRGIACSTRSACKLNEAMEEGGSHVLRALGIPNDVVLGAIRFSLGEDTTERELKRAVSALSQHVAIATAVPKPNF